MISFNSIFILSLGLGLKLHGPFVNLGVHLPPKDNSPLNIKYDKLDSNRDESLGGKIWRMKNSSMEDAKVHCEASQNWVEVH